MKTSHALSFSLLLGLGLAGVVAFAGCSSSSTPAEGPVVDSGVDTAVKDTAVKDTAVADTGPQTCALSLEAGSFAGCVDPPTVAGSSDCTSQAIEEYPVACIDSGWPTKLAAGCAAWQAKYASCFTCIKNWSPAQTNVAVGALPDRDACFFAIFRSTAFKTANPTLTDCAKNVKCNWDCQEAVCGGCDQTTALDDAGTTEFSNCATSASAKGGTAVPRGACYDVAGATANKCFNAPSDLTNCIVSEAFTPTGTGGKFDVAKVQQQMKVVLRGACRDNGDWSNATDAGYTIPETGPDAGAETSTDTGTATETGTDTGTATETGTDAADASEAG
jgi:hypothetical protein